MVAVRKFSLTIDDEPLTSVCEVWYKYMKLGRTYTGHFIMFSVITNIYNKKTK